MIHPAIESLHAVIREPDHLDRERAFAAWRERWLDHAWVEFVVTHEATEMARDAEGMVERYRQRAGDVLGREVVKAAAIEERASPKVEEARCERIARLMMPVLRKEAKWSL